MSLLIRRGIEAVYHQALAQIFASLDLHLLRSTVALNLRLLQIEICQWSCKSSSTQQVNLPRGFLFAGLLFDEASRIFFRLVNELEICCLQGSKVTMVEKTGLSLEPFFYGTSREVYCNPKKKKASLLQPILFGLSSWRLYHAVVV